MRVLITGGRGQLAADLATTFADCTLCTPGRADLDICDLGAIERALDAYAPTVVFNTAAFHKVDVCETEPELSFAVNAAAPQRLAAACARRGILLVHYSTDYVFDGAAGRPYREDEPMAPVNVYGASKAAGEMAIRCTLERHLIIRTTGLYGLAGLTTSRGNFVETMIAVGSTREDVQVVCDQVLTPTYTPDVAELSRRLVELGATGTYHVTNGGSCSWYEFAAEIFRLAELPARLEPVPQASRPMPARRPAYSVLAHDGLRRLGLLEPRPWQEALAAYLAARQELRP